MSPDATLDEQAFVGSVDELVEFVRSGEKPPERWRVGTEHEKIGLQQGGVPGAEGSRTNWTPLPYEGERGIGVLLERIADADGWKRVREGDAVVALEKDGASITLEPGGQLELSGAPLRTIHETCDEFHTHLSVLGGISESLGIVWLGLGMHPIHGVEAIPRMPKERYRIMSRYLPQRGNLALDMMHLTATVQANFDFADEADMVEKMRVSLALSPIVSAIFANSCLSEGKANGFVSRRLHIWHHVDPDRCGLLPFVFDPDFGYRRYVEWALDVPMFFVVRDGRYNAANGMTFRSFLREGFGGAQATFADFDRHLTTLFPDVRLKRVIEVRGADAVPPGLTCSLPALWKGILYDGDAREAAWGLVSNTGLEQREASRSDVARRGLAADFAGRPVLDVARELAAIAGEGLRRIGHRGRSDADETPYLEPIAEHLERGASPGEIVLEHWERDWAGSVDRLIDYARY